jgi:hypothetical protein
MKLSPMHKLEGTAFGAEILGVDIISFFAFLLL